MKIQKIISRNRRDFVCKYECQHCGKVEEGSGYDDHYFHSKVVPAMVCKHCGKSGGEDTPMQTKYPEGMQV